MPRRPIGRHQLPRQERGMKTKPESKGVEDGSNRISTLQKLMLNASLWGNEAACDFEQLYIVPVLQTLGLPLRLSTLTGAVSGPTATLLLPLLGWWTDRGSNPHRRKTIATVSGCGLSFVGMLCIITANVLHLHSLLQSGTNRTALDSSLRNWTDMVSVAFSDVVGNGSRKESVRNTSAIVGDGDWDWGAEGFTGVPEFGSTELVGDEENSEIPFKAVLALLGFIILDVGFDASNSCIKSLVLTPCPRSEHTSLLFIGLIIASAGGVSTAALGLVDFSSLLGFNYIKGARLTIQTTIQGAVIIVFIILGLPISLLTIRRLLRLQHSASEDTASISNPSESHPLPLDQVSLAPEERFSDSTILTTFENSLLSLGGGGGGSIHCDSSLALLDEIQRSGHHYDPPSSLKASSEETPLLGSPKMWTDHGPERPRRVSMSVSYKKRDSLSSIPEHSEPAKAPLMNVPEPENESVDKFQRKLPEADATQSQSCHRDRSCKVKIFLVLLASYFSCADLFLFAVTSSDFVGKAIYGGDPAALPGSPRQKSYQDGVRVASVGYLVYYVSFLIFSFVQTRLLPRIGYTAEFLAIHIVMAAVQIVLSLTEMLGVFFLLTVVAGAHRACVFSIPYAVVIDIMQSRAEERAEGKTSMGFIISLVATSLSLSYSTLFSWVGPLEELTGVVAVPYLVSAASAVLSILAFLAVGKVGRRQEAA